MQQHGHSITLAIFLGLALAGCSKSPPDESARADRAPAIPAFIPAAEAATPALAAAVAATPPPTFARCVACHDAGKGGPNKMGPNLFGAYGRAAAKHPGFNYSDGLKKSGISWTDKTLDKWLENPRALVPGTSMSFPGLKDPARRQEVIAYLKAQK